jgi:zinc protease
MTGRLLLIVLLCAPGLAAQAPNPPAGVERITSVEGITEYRLSNGLRVLLIPDPSKFTTTVNVTYLAGSRHENYGETGMAHIIEHLVSYGSPNHPDAKKEQQERGARRNATTSVDRTNYFETFPASDENLEWALDLEADRMVNAFVRKDILDSQMTVVRNEMEAGENNPLAAVSQRVMATAYLWHNYGKSTIGARSDVENVQIERLQTFYKKYYQPDNAVLIIAGKVDEAAAMRTVAQKFGPIPRPGRSPERTYTVEPAQDGERTVTVQRVGDVQAIFVAYRVPSLAHPDSAFVDLLVEVMAANPSGRLYKALVDSKKAAQVGGGNRSMLEEGIAALTVVVRKDSSLDEARSATMSTLDGLPSSLPTAEEVERARAELLRRVDLSLADSEAVGMALSEFSAAGDWRLLFLRRDRLRKATAEDVGRAAQSYFKPTNRTVGIFSPVTAPVRAEIPTTPDIAAMVKDYKGDPAAAVGEAFDPSTSNIETRTARASIAPGIKLALLPKKTRGATVNAVLRLNFGTEESLRAQSIVGELTAAMLNRGTTKRTRQQIRDELSRLRATVNAGGAAGFVQVSMQTVKANLPDAIRLAAELVRQPSFPDQEFEQLRQEALASAEFARSDPQTVASLSIARHINPYPKGHVRYVPSIDERVEDLKALKLDDVKRFHKEFFGSSNGELAIVGDFDADAVRKLATELFADWKSPKPFADVAKPYKEISPVTQSFQIPDKANAVFTAGMPLRLADQDKDYAALVLANYMIGGHSSSRLYTRIRAKEGLSYGVSSSLSVTPGQNGAELVISAIVAPQNASKLEAVMKEELERALKDGFPAEEIASAKKGWLESQRVSRSQDPELVGRLRSQLHWGRTMTFDADLEKRVEGLTGEEIAVVLRRHLDVQKLSIFKAGDFKKVGSSVP